MLEILKLKMFLLLAVSISLASVNTWIMSGGSLILAMSIYLILNQFNNKHKIKTNGPENYMIIFWSLSSAIFFLSASFSVGDALVIYDPLPGAMLYSFLISPLGIAAYYMARDYGASYLAWSWKIYAGAVSLLGIIFGREILGDGRYQIAGNIIAVGFISALWYLPQLKGGILNKWFVLYFALISVLIWGTMVFSSRQSIIAMLMASLAIGALYIISRKVSHKIGMMVLFPSLIILGVLFSVMILGTSAGHFNEETNLVILRFASVADSAVGTAADPSRIELQTAALEKFSFGKPFGQGAGYVINEISQVPGGYSHNFLVESVVEYGVLGGAIILMPIFFLIFYSKSRVINNPNSIFSLFIILMAASFVISNISGDIPTARFFWSFFYPSLGFIILKSEYPRRYLYQFKVKDRMDSL